MRSSLKFKDNLRISVSSADHYNLFRAGLVKVLESIKGLTVAGQVAAVEAGIDVTVAHTPDGLLLEMALPRVSGREAVRRIRSQYVGTRVLALTHWTLQPMPLQVTRVGIDGYSGKDIVVDKLKIELNTFRVGRRYIAENLAQDVARCAYGELASNPFQERSVREIQVVLMVLSCKTPTQIAVLLRLSSKTANSYRYRLFEKLDVKNDLELTMLAMRHKIIELAVKTTCQAEEITLLPSRDEPLGGWVRKHVADSTDDDKDEDEGED